MLENLLSEIYQAIYGQFVNIPLNNLWATLYVILNALVTLILTLLGYTGNGGSIFSSGGLF